MSGSTLTPGPAAEALRQLRGRFRETVATTLAAFRELAARLAATPDAPDVVSALRRELHRVHGTAGSYGYLEASRLAARLEAIAIRWAEEPTLDLRQRATVIEHFVEALQLAFEAADGEAPGEAPTSGSRLLLVGLPPGAETALRGDAPLHGYCLLSLEAEALDVDALAAAAPHVIVTPLERLAAVQGMAHAAGIPVIALDARPDGMPRALGNAAAVVRAGEVAALFAAADRLTTRGSWAGATVLVLDDDPSILAIVRFILEPTGVRVVTIEDPSALLDELRRARPSLLLMDVHLGDRDGVAIARALRAMPAHEDLPIVLFSTEASAAVREAAYRAGADEFVPKPLVHAELRTRLLARLERRRLERLAEGRHPGTGLPLAARTAREAPLAFSAARRQRRGVVVVTARPDGAEPEGEAAVAWLHETQRIAAALHAEGGFVGYLDGLTLHGVLDTGADEVLALLDALARGRPTAAPAWRAGVADAGAVGSPEWVAVRQAADEALDVARATGESLVQAWQREASDVAPDVIVVEDDPALSEMLQYALRAAGYSSRAFDTGPGALEALRRMQTLGRRPLVLLDVDLPGLDGHSLHDILRLERPGAFAVVFATIHGSEGEQIRALKAGAIDYVVKPLSLRILLAKIPVWVERAARREVPA